MIDILSQQTIGDIDQIFIEFELNNDLQEERKLRENNPAVKDAWEQYQIVLKLNRKNI